MGLQPRHAVDDVHAGALQGPRPLDVALLVEPGLQLDQADRLLALLGGAHQRGDDRRVAAGAVHRLLDGEDVRVLHRLLDEPLHAAVEVVVGVVHQHVAVADDGEQVQPLALLGAQARAGARLPGRVPEVRAVHHGEGPEHREVERGPNAVGLALLDLQGRHQLLDQAVRRRLLHLQPHHVPEPAPAQLRLDRADEVVRLVGDREVRVARHPEPRRLDDLHAREEALHLGLDDVLDEDEPVVDGDQARQPRRHLDPREPGLPLDGVAHPQAEVERQPRDVREREAGTHRQRREDGVDLAVEALVDGAALVGAEVGVVRDPDARRGEPGAHLLVPDAGLLGRLLGDALVDAVEHLLAREPVRSRGQAAGLERVLHRRHAHHEELVQVAREDREELAALQQRHARVARQRQDARVEVEPRELAVDVERRVAELASGRCLGCRRHRAPILDPRAPRRKGRPLRLRAALGRQRVAPGRPDALDLEGVEARGRGRERDRLARRRPQRGGAPARCGRRRGPAGRRARPAARGPDRGPPPRRP